MEKKYPLISIVIANYNHAFYLEQAITSVLNQKFDDYELIIIDGGSTDNSVEIIKKHEDKIAYWISEPDRGQSDAFNKGFKIAKGKFGFWLNADDLILPESLLKIKDAIEKNPKGEWFVANTIFIDKDDKIIKCRKGDRWHNCLANNSIIEVYGPSSIYRIDLLHKVGGFDESMYYSMDTDLWIRFAKAGMKFIRINHYMWAFRLHLGSKSSDSYTQNDIVPKFVLENHRILEKNNWRHTKYKTILKAFLKTITGVYLTSYLDSNRNKGKQIEF